MKYLTTLYLWMIGFSLLPLNLALTSTQTEIVHHTDIEDPQNEGFWSHNISWKSRWVKYWRQKTIYVPVWKKVWSPLVQNEWVPLPNAPAGWTKPNEEHKIQEVNY